MASISKFYLHDATTTLTGTLPGAASVSNSTANVVATNAYTNRVMNGVIGVSQVSASLTTLNSSSNQANIFRRWLSAPIAAQVFNANNFVVRLAASESSTNSDMFENGALYLGVWRPDTGARAGTFASVSSHSHFVGWSMSEPGTTQTAIARLSEPIYSNGPGGGGGTGAFTILDGDVLVVEVWSQQAQSMATAYTNTIFYDGTTEGSTTSNAAHIEFSVPVEMLDVAAEQQQFAYLGGGYY